MSSPVSVNPKESTLPFCCSTFTIDIRSSALMLGHTPDLSRMVLEIYGSALTVL
ncbi:hypothetical protein BVRB_5g109860 [Beta vulgaris subsp. vulgaris]|nr:hypothetical protein BVRB_5g109860 [Beta vulgaris subsp. vulgaris]